MFFPELGATPNSKFSLYLPLMVYNVNTVKQVSFKFDMQNNLFGKIFLRKNQANNLIIF